MAGKLQDSDDAPPGSLTKEQDRLMNFHVGAEVAVVRRSRDMSQEEFGRLVGIERSRLSKIESGQLPARADELNRIAGAVGISLVELVEPAQLRYDREVRAKRHAGGTDA